jgi:hypothetical protein
MTVADDPRYTLDDINDIPSFTEHPLPPLEPPPASANGNPDPWEDVEPAEPSQPLLHVVTLEEFASIHEPSADPLLGDKRNNLLAAGAISVVYGDGGAGKTTLFLDVAFHLATQSNWLGLDVPQRSRVLWIENEGPRGMFREKTDTKRSNWAGPPLNEYFHVLQDPWALFTFAQPQHRHELAQHVAALNIDVVIAGPVQRLGVQGGGTPAEVGQFIELVEQTRAELGRPLAFVFIHHENKSGEVSGAWEGIPDTLMHVFPQGNGRTRIHWQKARWAPDMHGKTWHLLWREGDTFEIDEKPENSDDEVRLSLLEAVEQNPGLAWGKLEAQVKGKGDRLRALRDLLLQEGEIVNLSTKPGKMALHRKGTENVSLGDTQGTRSLLDEAEGTSVSRVPTYKEGTRDGDAPSSDTKRVPGHEQGHELDDDGKELEWWQL